MKTKTYKKSIALLILLLLTLTFLTLYGFSAKETITVKNPITLKSAHETVTIRLYINEKNEIWHSDIKLNANNLEKEIKKLIPKKTQLKDVQVKLFPKGTFVDKGQMTRIASELRKIGIEKILKSELQGVLYDKDKDSSITVNIFIEHKNNIPVKQNIQQNGIRQTKE